MRLQLCLMVVTPMARSQIRSSLPHGPLQPPGLIREVPPAEPPHLRLNDASLRPRVGVSSAIQICCEPAEALSLAFLGHLALLEACTDTQKKGVVFLWEQASPVLRSGSYLSGGGEKRALPSCFGIRGPSKLASEEEAGPHSCYEVRNS